MKRGSMTDGKTERELMAELGRRAASYLPEWRFDPEQPDAGTALACIFARMHQGTLEQLERLPEKLETAFFNAIHTSMRPASPAEGYVSFGLANDTMEGTELSAGTVLVTEALGENGERVPLETREDVYVSPVTFTEVFESFDGRDFIGKLYEAGEEQRPFSAFGFAEENLQRHVCWIGHSQVFDVRGGARVDLAFSAGGGRAADSRFLEALCDSAQARLSYFDGEGYAGFEQLYAQDGKLCLVKGAGQRPWEEEEVGGLRSRWLRIEALSPAVLKDFGFRSLRAASCGDLLAPEVLAGSSGELPRREYYPFGEQFSIYDEVCFASDEALSKAGAVVQLSFQREFVRVPLNLGPGQHPDWRLIMRRNQFQVEREYDISIGEVVWEYYNGSGWARLFAGREYGDVFGIEGGVYRQKVGIVFTCPPDAAPVLVGSREARCIRARICKVNNAYKTQGQYLAPLLSETWFQYQYRDGVVPEALAAENSLELLAGPAAGFLDGTYPFRPFCTAGDGTPALYFGSVQPWERGPLRILFAMEGRQQEAMPPVVWEYSSGTRWKELNPADGTEHFARTGLVTFAAPADMEKRRRFGRERYWLRARRLAADETGRRSCPAIGSWHYNSARAWSVRSGFREVFTVEGYAANPSFRLGNRGIYRLEVWVDETEGLGGREREALRAQDDLREFADEDGRVRRTLVRWKEQDSFQASGPRDRHYLLDANEGIVTFGDGSRGRQLEPGTPDGIEVLYSIGCGSGGNLGAGQVSGLDLSLGYINRATNPLPFSGGYDRESAGEAVRRRAGELRHRFRAVTASDYEKLALEASGAVERAYCLPGRNQRGERTPGHVAVLLLQKDFEDRGHRFPALREQVAAYMEDKLPAGLSAGGRFHLVPPEFVEIVVSVDLWVDDYNRMFACRHEAEERLAQFLHPLKGGFTGRGWPAGRLPGRSQIDTLLKNIPLVRDVRNLVIAGLVRRAGTAAEVGLDELEGRPFALPLCGNHRIRIHI